MSNLKLGITNVKGLLLNNQFMYYSDNKTPNSICGFKELKIPDYQRPYKWTAKNALQLFYDIKNAYEQNKEVYRLGTLILSNDKDDEIYNIVDGQQRIITISLLLKCLLNRDDEDRNEKCDDEKKEKLESKEDRIENTEEKTDDKKINFLSQELKNNKFSKFNIKNNFLAFKRKIESEEKKFKDDFYIYLLNNCEFVNVITNNISEAFQFFDSQNARGKSLYPHDLLKAYHLREMTDLNEKEVETIVKTWEDMSQDKLGSFFAKFIYVLKQWISNNTSYKFTDKDIDIFKGIAKNNNFPYAQYFKGAYIYANDNNNSNIDFVYGIHKLRKFQLYTPIISGKPFFEFSKYYYDILSDIQDNSKYEGYYINGNEYVKVLDEYFQIGTGNMHTRLIFDLAILLYIDRFCPDIPAQIDIDNLNEFVKYAFIWAYSLRLQYISRLEWDYVQNYVLNRNGKKNALNIYRILVDSNSPSEVFRVLSDRLKPLSIEDIIKNGDKNSDSIKDKISKDEYKNLIEKFEVCEYWEEEIDAK